MGPHPHCAAPFLSLILCLPRTCSSSLSFCPAQATLRCIFPSILPLLYVPLSVYVSRLPHLFSLPPMLPLLSPMSTAAENPAQTPACVFVRTAVRWICKQASHAREPMKKWLKRGEKEPHACLSNAPIKTSIAEGYIMRVMPLLMSPFISSHLPLICLFVFPHPASHFCPS